MAVGGVTTTAGESAGPLHGRLRPALTAGRLLRLTLVALAILAALLLLALITGAGGIDPAIVGRSIAGDDVATTILLELRLPRILLAISAGAALAASGVTFQAILRNPLAEPYILGISNGCAIGAILGILVGAGTFGSPLFAIVGGIVAVVAVLAVGRGRYGLHAESMLLGGVMVGAIGAAMIFLLLHLVGPQLRSALQWMLGDLASASAAVGYASPVLLAILAALMPWAGDRLNALSLGDDEAASLGIDVSRTRTVAYLFGSTVVGVTVAFCGAIGFVGLVVPHILRRIVGPDHRALYPLSIIGGGIFLLACDTLARGLLVSIDGRGGELPIGAVTALVGAPIFIHLLRLRTSGT